MAFTVLQAGATLQLMASDGTLSTLTLPTGVTLSTTVQPRWAVTDRYVVLVNTPSQALTVDADGIVRLLTTLPPRIACTLAANGASTLNGTYAGVKYTFLALDSVGNIVSESDYSPASNSVTLAGGKFLKASGLDISPTTITARRLYRPTSNGTTLYPWIDLYGNTLTEIQDDLSDTSLQLLAAPTLGTPPRLTLVADFKQRLWGVGDLDIDNVRYSEAGVRYAWPADNLVPVARGGSDAVGISAFVPRRDTLGIGRQNALFKLTGTDEDDFAAEKVTENCGILSQESVSVHRDVAYFLWQDGVYQWSSDGLVCLSDGAGGVGEVRNWFVSNDYFNRSRFRYAFGAVNPETYKYRLWLASAESDIEDSWVEFDINARTWWGPHTAATIVPRSAFTITQDALADSALDIAALGSDAGDVWRDDRDSATDGANNGIALDVDTQFYDNGDPSAETYWGELTIVNDAQATGGTLAITPTVGTTASAPQSPMPFDLSLDQHGCGRLGSGNLAKLNFTHDGADEPVVMTGFDIEPVRGGGRR